METTQSPGATYQPAFADRMKHSKALVAIVAVLGVTVLALAAALVVNRSEAQSGVPAPVALAAPVVAAPAITAPAPVVKPVPPAPKPVAAAPKPVYTNNSNSSSNNAARPVPAVVARANVCSNCGTVEAVTAIKRQGQVNGVAVGNTTIGLGTVAGGVLGGLLGHQVGGGNGKTAMAVLGAAGGAYAGNKVEQNMKSVTVYDVRVRMADGSVRNMEISSPVAVGAQVTVEGKNLRLATAAG
ncbi:MAG: glycine zipper 2TM domain-containing protein [Pseudomonadota bacterium]